MKIGELTFEIRRSLADLAADIEWRGADYEWVAGTEVRLTDDGGGRKTELRIEIAEEAGNFSVSLRLEPLRTVCERAVVKDGALVLLVMESFMDTMYRPAGVLPGAAIH